MLPQFPQFFEDIYEIRQNIHATDPQMIKDIEDLYEKTMKNVKPEDRKDKSLEEETKNLKPGDKKLDTINRMPAIINESEFLSTF